MTRFFVNNMELILPSDYSFTDIEENPLLTENGEYTLDFEVSLLEPQNLKALDFQNRKNKISYTDSFSATKIVDGKTSYGTIVIVNATDAIAKCQFVSGNSEVTYLTGEDKKIWELDFGTEQEITVARAMDSVVNPSWTKGFCCIPVKFSNLVSNNYVYPLMYYNTTYGSDSITFYPSDGNSYPYGNINLYPYTVENITMHVYLLYIINKLGDALGFSILNNVLESDEKLKKTILINNTNSLDYNSALPDMTIRDFISSIETSYNVVFKFNSNNKTLDIINTINYLNNMGKSKEIVLDSFTREPNDNPYRFDFSQLSYSLGSDGLQKYQKLSDDIVDACTVSQFQSLTLLKNILSDSVKNQFILYESLLNKRQYIFSDSPTEDVYRQLVSSTTGRLVHVNKFRDYYESEKKKIELKICPIEFTYSEIIYKLVRESQTTQYPTTLPLQMPVISSDLFILADQDIIPAIESGITSIPRSSVMQICLYNGMMELLNIQNGYKSVLLDGTEDSYIFVHPKYPVSFVDDRPEIWHKEDETGEYETNMNYWINNLYSPVATDTLRLVGPNGIKEKYYSENSLIDTDYIYTFLIQDSATLNVRTKLEYDGGEYIYSKIERTRSGNDNDVRIAKAYCYKLK